jgi:hypothetical protein
VVESEISRPPVWSFDSSVSEHPWTTAIFSFLVPSGSYRILIEANFSLKDSIIALDNIIFEGENGEFFCVPFIKS